MQCLREFTAFSVDRRGVAIHDRAGRLRWLPKTHSVAGKRGAAQIVQKVRVLHQVAHRRTAAHAGETRHPVLQVREKTLASDFAVVDHVDADIALTTNHRRGGGQRLLCEFAKIDGVSRKTPRMQRRELGRARQTACMGRENSIGRHSRSFIRPSGLRSMPTDHCRNTCRRRRETSLASRSRRD